MTEPEVEHGVWVRAAPAGLTRMQVRCALVAAALLLVTGLWTLRDFLPALVWAGIFAIGLWPLFARLAQMFPAHRRGLLPALTVLAIFLVFVIPVTIAGISAAAEAHSAAQWIDHVRAVGLAPPSVLQTLPGGAKLSALWQSNLGQPAAISGLLSKATQGGLLDLGRRFGAQALHRLVLVFFMLLVLFFLLREADNVIEQLRVGARRAFGQAGEDVGRQIILSVKGTVNGLVLVGLAEGAILGVAYWIAGLPHPSLFGILTALLAMVPFGAVIAVGVATLALLALNKIVAAIAIGVFGFLLNFVGDHFFRPVLIGGATKLPFVWVLLGILGGVEAWGLVGLFVGPAVLAALMLLWRQWVGSREGAFNPAARDVPETPAGVI